MTTCRAGPAVSLQGSPTVSPVTAALCASLPLPPKLPISTAARGGGECKAREWQREGGGRGRGAPPLQLMPRTVLLGIVPRAAHIVQEERHEDARGGGKHEKGHEHLCAQQRAPREGANEAKGEAHNHGQARGQEGGRAHLNERRLGDNGHAGLVVGLGLLEHDVGVVLELPAHVLDHLLRAAPHGRHGQAHKVKDHHDAQQAAHHDLGHCARGRQWGV